MLVGGKGGDGRGDRNTAASWNSTLPKVQHKPKDASHGKEAEEGPEEQSEGQVTLETRPSIWIASSGLRSALHGASRKRLDPGPAAFVFEVAARQDPRPADVHFFSSINVPSLRMSGCRVAAMVASSQGSTTSRVTWSSATSTVPL